MAVAVNTRIALSPLIDALKAMPRLNRKSKYHKIAKAAADIFDVVHNLSEYAEKYNVDWREWKEGFEAIVEAFVRPEFRDKLYAILETVEERVKEKLREEFERHFEEYMRKVKRYVPAYVKVLDFLIDNPEYLELYERSPMEAYRRVAERTGLSWRTVRDSFWMLRRSGLL